MKKRVLPFSFTADEMDRACGMQYHPMGGLPYRIISVGTSCPKAVYEMYGIHRHIAGEYLEEEKCYEHKWGFLSRRWILPRMGDGKRHRCGVSYPKHWLNDPFTGEILSKASVAARLARYFSVHKVLILPMFPKMHYAESEFRSPEYYQTSLYELYEDYILASEQTQLVFLQTFGKLIASL